MDVWMKDSHQQQFKTQAYIWTRELIYDRLQKIHSVQQQWERLFHEPGDRGHYNRFQWLGTNQGGICSGEKFLASIDGQELTIHLKIITTREWFAKEAYTRALTRTRNRYPNFDAHRFINGSRIGERIIEFLSEEHELAWGYFWTSLRKIVVDEKLSINEVVIIEPCSLWGYPVALASSKTYGNEIIDDHRLITLVRHTNEVDKTDFDVAKNILVDGKSLEIDPEAISYSFDDIREGFIQLASPELVVLNWSDARPLLSEADFLLHKAAYQLDRVGVEKAISTGANVNYVDSSNSSVLKNVIEGWGDHRAHYKAKDEDLDWYDGPRPVQEIPEEAVISLLNYLLNQGAHPDLHGPEESPAIVSASLGCHARIVELLLNCGANAAVQCYWDSYVGEWPQAWESPSFDAYHKNDQEAQAVYDLLLLNRPSPNYSKEIEELEIAKALGINQPIKHLLADSQYMDSTLGEAWLDDKEDGYFLAEKILREIPEDKDITAWIKAQANKLIAEACVRYALAFNSNEPDWLVGVLSPSIKYESQSVFAPLLGRDAVMDYLRGKIKTIHKTPDNLPRFELANMQGGEPCVAGFQSQGALDKNWRSCPITNIKFDHDVSGLINDIFIITVAPSPSAVLLSDLCLGINSQVVS
jgi:hypothetical protein